MRHKQRRRIQIEHIDIREVLDELGISYREKGKNVGEGWIGVCCPFCSDNNYHLGINLNGKSISCFKCGTTGTVIKYLAEELNSFEKAIEILRVAVPRELRGTEESDRERVLRVALPKEADRKITPYHAGYLQSRGFDYLEVIDLYNPHFCGPIGDWANRIIFPIVKNYRLVSFTSVDISDETQIRYKHLSKEESIIHAKEWLFGLEHTDHHSVIVVEGLFDMMRIGPGAVCTFGTKVTAEQRRELSKFQKVVIAFDGDDAGMVAGERLAFDLSPFCDTVLLGLPEGRDPDSLPPEDVRFIRSKIGK